MTLQAPWDTPAACADPNVAPWFDAAFALERPPNKRRERELIQHCRTVCAGCPSRTACAALSRAGEERWGVWAGEHLPSRVRGACGSVAGYQQHRRGKTAVCVACRDAWNAYQRAQTAAKAAS